MCECVFIKRRYLLKTVYMIAIFLKQIWIPPVLMSLKLLFLNFLQTKKKTMRKTEPVIHMHLLVYFIFLIHLF